MILVILQNAWGVEDGYIPTFKRESFRKCYTGKRLSEMLPTLDVEIRNATPKIGDSANSYIEADCDYLSGEIEKIKPSAILACGKSAKNILDVIKPTIPIIYAPHPAWRQLSKEHTSKIKEQLVQI